MENKTLRLYTRIIPAEKKRIFSLAKRCGLSVSEYIRQRVLGFTPREIQPEIFYELVRRIEAIGGGKSFRYPAEVLSGGGK